MKLIHTALGELYQSFSAQELKELDLYLKRQVLNKGNTLIQLHKLYREAKQSKQLDKLDTQYIKNELFENSDKGTTKQTTYTNFLLQHIKEFLILSKIKEKNIYTETLYGEILIEKGLKKNLLLKLSNYKFNLYQDSYALLKNFLHKREAFFYQHMILTKRNYSAMVEAQELQIKGFKEYVKFYLSELYSSFITVSNRNHTPVDIEKSEVVKLLMEDNLPSNDLLKIQLLILSLTIDRSEKDYYTLKDFFFDNFDRFSEPTYIQVIPTLLNYAYSKLHKGKEEFDIEIYKLFYAIYDKRVLFKYGIFTVVRLINYIRLELRYGKIEFAEMLLKSSLDVVPNNQKISFQHIVESRIDFAKRDYKNSLNKIGIINPSDSIHYYQHFKIMLIKCSIMLGDSDRLTLERESFYKYVYNHKDMPDDEKRRHKLFVRYSEYLIEGRFEYLTDYMHRRIENALLSTSPYFTEKEWVRERWNELKAKFD